MLRNTINQQIKEAMLSKNKDKLYVMKMIKAEFLKFQTSKGFNDNDFTDVKELSILQKMEKSWNEEIDMFKQGGRDTTELQSRLDILKTYLPKDISDDEIKEIILNSGIEINPKNMKQFMSVVQSKFPQVNGKQISTVIKSLMS